VGGLVEEMSHWPLLGAEKEESKGLKWNVHVALCERKPLFEYQKIDIEEHLRNVDDTMRMQAEIGANGSRPICT
jgi:hypothetical protein